MLKIDETTGAIALTRGDTARFYTTIEDDVTGEDYIVKSGDTIRFTIKKTYNDSVPLVQKVIEGSNLVHIQPNDTKSLPFGKYVYDVEITTESGDVYTFIGPNVFEVTKEVT